MKEKSDFEKRAAEKQVSLLTEALTSAVDAKGHWSVSYTHLTLPTT